MVDYNQGSLHCAKYERNQISGDISLCVSNVTIPSHSDIQFGVQVFVLTRTTPLKCIEATAM